MLLLSLQGVIEQDTMENRELQHQFQQRLDKLQVPIITKKGIVEKAQETSSDTGMHDTVCFTVLHEQWMYLGMHAEKHPHNR